MAHESLGPFRSGCRRKTEVDMFKSKAPDKEKNAVANAAEVVGSTAQQQHSVVEHPPRRRWSRRRREHALASAPACRLSATSNAMVQRRSSAESNGSCAPLTF